MNRRKKLEKGSEEKGIRITLDLTKSEYAALLEAMETNGHHSIVGHARVAFKFYAKMTDLLHSSDGVYVKNGDTYEQIHVIF